jgi:trans-aconitate 2-methyltransferase
MASKTYVRFVTLTGMWDPGTYLRYADERSRPFFDLLARVDHDDPRAVVDLGCGPGTLTRELARRWPRARITGLDSSAEMIDAARAQPSTVDFTVLDARDWHAAPDVDVVICNAVLQWVPGHRDLLRRWIGELGTGAVFAFQVPGNFAAPSHRAIHEVAADFGEALAGVLRDDPVAEPVDYAGDLLDLGCRVDAWETTYLHVLTATDTTHPVLSWVEGTALRPVRAALDDIAWRRFRDDLTVRLNRHYPIHNGRTIFPFRRIFVVATKA